MLFQYQLLRLLHNVPGFPTAYSAYSESDTSFLIMDLLGPNLSTLFQSCKNIFSMKTICMIAEQVFLRIEALHYRHFTHGNISPRAFTVGLKKSDPLIYMVGLSSAKRVRNPPPTSPSLHFPSQVNILYASLDTHNGLTPSYRGDLESAFYMFVHFAKGTLPWSTILSTPELTSSIRLQVQQMKAETTPEQLCDGLPAIFEVCLKYIKCLEYPLHFHSVFLSYPSQTFFPYSLSQPSTQLCHPQLSLTIPIFATNSANSFFFRGIPWTISLIGCILQ